MVRPRIVSDKWPAAVYAIGDVHGYSRQLVALEEQIVADGAEIPGEKWIITLGDYVDRGPDTAGVINHLLKPMPNEWRRIALIGNHEEAMLDYLRDPVEQGWWLVEGGKETVESYEIDVEAEQAKQTGDLALHLFFSRSLPPEHLEFLNALPVAASLPGWFFTHAGIRPGVPLHRQSDEDLIWIRSPFLETDRRDGVMVVHGHTPGRKPVITPWRIGLDTHCFVTGTLTGMRITPDGTTKILTANGPVVPWR